MKRKPATILIVDDDELSLEFYSVILESGGYEDIDLIQDSRKVMDHLAEKPASVVLLDLNMPHVTGSELLTIIKEEHPETAVIVITGESSVDTAVSCMKEGAFDYLTKPVEQSRLLSVVKRAIEIRELREEVTSLGRRLQHQELRQPEAFSSIITVDDQMRALFQYIEAIADSPRSILITGESGTGKELFARAIHDAGKKSGSFVPVNVSGLDDTMFSDTLFGHRKGAYTGAESERQGLIEKASEGTLFLDEIGDMQLGSQVKLLRLLQEGEYYALGEDEPRHSGARVIAATNADLGKLQGEGLFRKDLFYRLIAHQLNIPPLRKRKQDIPVLTDYFLEKAAFSMNKKKPSVPSELYTLLETYHFPGNVRELEAIISDSVSRHTGGILSIKYIRDYIENHRRKGEKQEEAPATDELNGQDFKIIFPEGHFPTLVEVEKYLMDAALEKSAGNQTVAASLLGISQSTLSRHLKE
ncbi:MAG: sigma-54 dependent transcriptional regulator [Spirochaetales bacterium]|nr:sigma-54 dependent transcriptional regulator [Spirochaetales bacterium]MCF7937513.1 sigma-54 dependent transcriptional regulator [Spirochaetales bacterium]